MKIIIVPYRNRISQKEVFINHMKHIFDEQILFIHQSDNRPFNRGALKNIGFLYVKQIYPNTYKDITLIFHDIDFLPYKKDIIPYDTKKGEVSHFFGFKFALGGIFAIKGEDFEKILGFPNYWGWGYEDNKIQKKWINKGGKINYEHFHDINNTNIIRLGSGLDVKRLVNTNNVGHFKYDSDNHSGFNTISNLKFNITPISDKNKMINVTSFLTEENDKSSTYIYQIPRKKYKPSGKTSLMGRIINSQPKKSITFVKKHSPLISLMSNIKNSI